MQDIDSKARAIVDGLLGKRAISDDVDFVRKCLRDDVRPDFDKALYKAQTVIATRNGDGLTIWRRGFPEPVHLTSLDVRALVKVLNDWGMLDGVKRRIEDGDVLRFLRAAIDEQDD